MPIIWASWNSLLLMKFRPRVAVTFDITEVVSRSIVWKRGSNKSPVKRSIVIQSAWAANWSPCVCNGSSGCFNGFLEYWCVILPWKYVAANFWNLNSDKSSSSSEIIWTGLIISCWSALGAGRSCKMKKNAFVLSIYTIKSFQKNIWKFIWSTVKETCEKYYVKKLQLFSHHILYDHYNYFQVGVWIHNLILGSQR